ncbi:hypothetical protein F5X99DRAFT_297988 [Biscogniauxia marginata]|nr:hypothetical protein F5X99DRAFT_297988 [Biscogniauxia marginata]
MEETQSQTPRSFWAVFIDAFPKPPSVDELVCEVIGNNYPEGVLTDKDGNRLAFSRDLETVDDEMLETLEGAFDELAGFIPKLLDARDIDYKTGSEIVIGYETSLREAAIIIHDAIREGGLLLLDQILWDCYRKAGGKKKRQPYGRPSRFIESV